MVYLTTSVIWHVTSIALVFALGYVLGRKHSHKLASKDDVVEELK